MIRAMMRFLASMMQTKAAAPVAVSSSDAAALAWLTELFGGTPKYSGVSVTPENALHYGVAYACVAVISQACAQLPVHLYRRTADGGKERAVDHPAYPVLADMANPWTASYDFRQAMTSAALRYDHGAFAQVIRVGGEVQELLQLPSAGMRVTTDPLTQEPVYWFSDARGRVRQFDHTEILHLRPMDAVAPLTAAAEAIGTLVAMERHQAKLFARGARPSGSLTLPKGMSADAIKRAATSWNKAHAGEGGGGTAVLEEGITWTAHEFKSTDAQFLELRQHQIAEIARPFRIPPHLLQELGRATWGNSEALGLQFLQLTLMPWLEAWRAAVRRSLLTPAERQSLVVEFTIDDLARATLADRMTAYATAITYGVLSPNEVRAMENRAPYAGGDEYRLPLNTAAPGAAE